MKTDNGIDIFEMSMMTKPDRPTESEKKTIDSLSNRFVDDPTEENFEKLMKRMKWGLRGFMFKILQNDYAVDECMSRTMENVWFKIGKFDRDKGNLSTWIYKIAYNNCLKYMNGGFGYNGSLKCEDDSDGESAGGFSSKRRSRFVPIEMNRDGGQSVPYPNDLDFWRTFDMVYSNGRYVPYTTKEAACDAYDASVKYIENLPDRFQFVLNERYIKRKRVVDIATENNIPLHSVKNWLRRGLLLLREQLKDNSPELYHMVEDAVMGGDPIR